mmetsp:Transcript_15135/g.30844  ORF Transcript_15135/g.30844 Transcript_15135/m.30844 type:complete len:262 (-) Transcript_15135:533-1318(-)
MTLLPLIVLLDLLLLLLHLLLVLLVLPLLRVDRDLLVLNRCLAFVRRPDGHGLRAAVRPRNLLADAGKAGVILPRIVLLEELLELAELRAALRVALAGRFLVFSALGFEGLVEDVLDDSELGNGTLLVHGLDGVVRHVDKILWNGGHSEHRGHTCDAVEALDCGHTHLHHGQELLRHVALSLDPDGVLAAIDWLASVLVDEVEPKVLALVLTELRLDVLLSLVLHVIEVEQIIHLLLHQVADRFRGVLHRLRDGSRPAIDL